MNGTDPESELVGQFRSLAGASPGTGTQVFEFRIQGVHIHVLHQPGSSSSLYLSAFYPDPGKPTASIPRASPPIQSAPMAIRPMSILLRPETEGDREAKQRGVAVETQSGDPHFDAQVFIDTRTPAQTIAYVLSSPYLRAGIQSLLADGCSHIVLDDERERITAHLQTFTDLQQRPGRAQRMLDALVNVALHAPYIQRSSKKHPPDTLFRWLIAGSVIAGLLLTMGPLPYFLAADAFCGEKSTVSRAPWSYMGGCHAPMPLGILIGAVLGVIWGKLIAGQIRGHSNSHTRAAWAYILAVALSIELTIGLLCAVLWSL